MATSEVETALCSTIVEQSPAPWGRKNTTIIASLADGRRVIVQTYRDAQTTARRVRRTRAVAMSGLAKLLRVPTVLADGSNWAVFAYLDGGDAYTVAGPDLAAPAWVEIAREMGKVAGWMRVLPAPSSVSDVWADPASLAAAADEWLTDLASHLRATDLRRARALVAASADQLGDERPVLAHGDFGPQNVLVEGGHVTGLLDFEDCRAAHPLLDTAWWVWLVRTHTPEAFRRGWPAYLDGTGLDIDDHDDRLFTLMVLRLLETADGFRRSAPAKHPSWGRRLGALLDDQASATYSQR
jgi:aminoglycoside phosphotransferase (APT) family kinase protein